MAFWWLILIILWLFQYITPLSTYLQNAASVVLNFNNIHIYITVKRGPVSPCQIRRYSKIYTVVYQKIQKKNNTTKKGNIKTELIPWYFSRNGFYCSRSHCSNAVSPRSINKVYIFVFITCTYLNFKLWPRKELMYLPEGIRNIWNIELKCNRAWYAWHIRSSDLIDICGGFWQGFDKLCLYWVQ